MKISKKKTLSAALTGLGWWVSSKNSKRRLPLPRKLHGHPVDPADSNDAEARTKIKKIAATSNHKIFSAVTGPLPLDALSLLPGEDNLKKIAQRARARGALTPPLPRAFSSLLSSTLIPKTAAPSGRLTCFPSTTNRMRGG